MKLESKIKLPPGRVNKDPDAYIDRVYEYNKELFEKMRDDVNARSMIPAARIRDMKKLVKENIKGFMDMAHGDVREAVKAFGRSADFYTKQERRTKWVESHIREHEELLKEFRRVYGWQKKIAWDELRIEDAYTFSLGGIIISLPRDSKGNIKFLKGNSEEI